MGLKPQSFIGTLLMLFGCFFIYLCMFEVHNSPSIVAYILIFVIGGIGFLLMEYFEVTDQKGRIRYAPVSSLFFYSYSKPL
jgi:hypothetical protein